jgi:hypothetical protein
MSYCRFTRDSEVYAFDHVDGNFQCFCCKINLGQSLNFTLLSELRRHLTDHLERGDKVPDYAFAMIDEELADGVK